MAAVNKYIREELSLFSEAFAAMALWMEDYPLEDPFETISSSIYPTGTAAVPLPDSLANLMAGIVNLMDEGIRVLDPCCGSGAFILSAARVSREQEFFGSDIFLICCLMMLINMYLYDLTLQGSHRNLHRAQSCQPYQPLLRQ